MKTTKILFLTICAAFTLISCFEDLDDNPIENLEINDFVWKGMNAVYVYKDEIPDLANNRFEDSDNYRSYLEGFDTPEDLFESLLYLPDDVDEFSAIVPNYFDLEQLLQGTTLNNGMAFGLVKLPNATENIIGYVRYVLPNTDAEANGVTRGMIFNSIDGVVLTETNFRDLLQPITYTIDLASYDNNGTPETRADDIITPTNNSITLSKSEYTENPILIHDVLNANGNSIGYLMYNGFRIGNSNLDELNTVFAEFKSSGVSDLVLDLRYNGGGSVSTAIWLSSMITGQFTGDLLFKEKWNSAIQASLEQNDPESVNNLFVNEMIKRDADNNIIYQQPINSLNLNKVYIITTGSSASASELVINSLTPYIEVVQIGTTTRGKPQASITIYDSENFRRTNANPNHNYALQPLIYESENADGFSEYYDGLGPTSGFGISELYENLGELGDINERLLSRAISAITGLGRTTFLPQESIKQIGDDKFGNPFINDMLDDTPLKYDMFKQ